MQLKPPACLPAELNSTPEHLRRPFTFEQMELAILEDFPDYAPVLAAMRPIVDDAVPYMAVDRKWRCYINPELLTGNGKYGFWECCGILMHEALHCVLRHGERTDAIKLPIKYKVADNYSKDACINHMLRREIASQPASKVVLPADGIFPETLGCPDENAAFESILRWLLSNWPEETETLTQPGDGEAQDGQGPGEPSGGTGQGEPSDDGQGESSQGQAGDGDASQGQGGQGQGQGESSQGQGGQGQGQGESSQGQGGHLPKAPQWGGSCADGEPREYEAKHPETDRDKKGTGSQEKREEVLLHLAEKLESGGGRGDGSSAIAQAIARHSVKGVGTPNVFAQLKAHIRGLSGQLARGGEERSYRRLSKRYHSTGIIQPSNWTITPHVCLAIDTSGSMGAADIGIAKDTLMFCLQHFRLQDGLTVAMGDTRVQAVVAKVHDFSQLPCELRGRGGTDMNYVMVKAVKVAAERAWSKVDVLVVVTDCITYFPNEKAINVPTIVVATRPMCRNAGGWAVAADRSWSVPSWIHVLHAKPIVG